MTDAATLYQEAQDLGEIVSNGIRYRIFFDSMRHRTVCVRVAGRGQGVGSTVAIDNRSDA